MSAARPLAVRFWEKVEKGPGCWEWRASVATNGYGQVWTDTSAGRGGKKMAAHRCAWLLTHGELPAGLCVLHRCDNPLCVRPDHLFLGTLSDNTQDMLAKGRNPSIYRTKSHCKRGHSMKENLRIAPNGRRRCLQCHRIAALAAYHRKQSTNKVGREEAARVRAKTRGEQT